jgi:hypothetical protein
MADQDVVSLSGNVLEDISSFRGEAVDFELDSINRVRESFGVPPIARDSATKAILHAMTEDAPDGYPLGVYLYAKTLALRSN